MLNQKGVAKLAEVSSATVSRVVNKDPRVSSKTRKKILDIINNSGYIPNIIAKNLKLSKTKIIGYLVSNIHNPFFPSVLDGIENVCTGKNYRIILENTNENEKTENRAITTLLELRVDGIIAIFVKPSDVEIKGVERFGTPLVLIDRRSDYLKKYDYVGINNIDGMIKIVKYLNKLGHTKIAIIHGPVDITPGHERLEGYKIAIKNLGININNDFIINGYFTESGGYEGIKKIFMLEDRPTACIFSNNLIAMGAYKALMDLKVKIPEQISIIGFDDFKFASYFLPPLTVLDRPTKEMGKLAAQILLERIDNGNSMKNVKNIILNTELIIRESCADL